MPARGESSSFNLGISESLEKGRAWRVGYQKLEKCPPGQWGKCLPIRPWESKSQIMSLWSFLFSIVFHLTVTNNEIPLLYNKMYWKGPEAFRCALPTYFLYVSQIPLKYRCACVCVYFNRATFSHFVKENLPHVTNNHINVFSK